MTQDQSAREELDAELRRILQLLWRHLAMQRQSGRSPASDPLRGMVIEEGEAEGLVAELRADLARPPGTSASPIRDVSHTAEIADAESRASETPLRRAARVFRLGLLEIDALVLALAVELDQRFARLVAYLNDHVARTRPTVGLVLALADTDASAVEFFHRPAVRQSLLLLEGDGPLSVLALRVAPEILSRLAAP